MLTIGGFIATLINVRRSAKAAKAAEDAAEGAKRAAINASREIAEKISIVNVVVSLSAAMSTMKEIRRLNRNKEWGLLLERYGALLTSLIEIKMHATTLIAKEKKILQSAVSFFSEALSITEQLANDSNEPYDVVRLNQNLSRHINELTGILERLKSTASEK